MFVGHCCLLGGFWKALLPIGGSLKGIVACWGKLGRNSYLFGAVWKKFLLVRGVRKVMLHVEWILEGIVACWEKFERN